MGPIPIPDLRPIFVLAVIGMTSIVGGGLYGLPHLMKGSHHIVTDSLGFDVDEIFDLMEVYDDICSSNVQNFTNRGTLDVSSTLQFGGITAGVTTRVGSPD